MIVVAIIAWPAALFVCCCNREQANKLWGAPVDANGQVSNAIPF